MSNNFFPTNITGFNPFTSNPNKSNSPSNNNANPNVSLLNANTSNLFGSKPLASGLSTNNNPIFSNTNQLENANKEDNKDHQGNKQNPFNIIPQTNIFLNSNAPSTSQTNSNQGIFGNSFQSNAQNSGNLFKNKDGNQATFNKQFSFSSGNDVQANNLSANQQNNPSSNIFGNTNNPVNNLNNNQKKEEEVKVNNQAQNKIEFTRNPLNITSNQENSNKNDSNNPTVGQNQNINKNLFGSSNNDNMHNLHSNMDYKFGSSNSFLKPNPTNKESNKVENTSFPPTDKKIQNPEQPLISSKQIEKANENNPNKSNLFSVNEDFSKNEFNKMSKDSKESFHNIAIKKPSDQIKENRTIEDFKTDKLMSLSIDDLINKWKLELDNQVDKFEKAADSIKNFELNFQNQYDKVGHLSELINKITENGENTLNELTNISREEDYIINQLDCMERNLDKFFDIVPKNTSQNDKSFSLDDKIYSSALELDSSIKDIQSEINTIQNNFNVQSENHAKKVENLKSFHENNSGASFDEKDISVILNSYFDSLRALQLMMHSVESKVQDISFDLNENKKEY